MSPTLIAFLVGVFVGVPLGIFIIGILQMGREEMAAPLDDWGPPGPITENGKQKTENGT